MKAARKSFGAVSRGLGELAGTLGREKSLPIHPPAPELYPPELSVDDAAGEELLQVSLSTTGLIVTRLVHTIMVGSTPHNDLSLGTTPDFLVW